MKQFFALTAGVLVTALVGLGMLAVGVSAATNQDRAPVSNAPADTTASTSDLNAPINSQITQYQDREKQYQAQLDQSNAQIQQLKNLVSQYQNREQQYQTQLTQANAQAQQYLDVLTELQRRGLIRIQNDGTVQLLRGGR